MINIFAISMLFARQLFEMSPGGFGPSGLKSSAKSSIPFSGTIYSGTRVNDPVRVRGQVFDPEVKTEYFRSLESWCFNIFNRDYQEKPFADPVINEVRLSCVGQVDPVEFLLLVLSEDYGNFDSLVPESEADRIGAMKSTETGIERDGRSGLEPMNSFFLRFVGNGNHGDGSDHELGGDACGFPKLVVDQLLDGPFSESLIEVGCLRDGITGIVEEPHSLQEEVMLLRRGFEIYL